MLENVGIKNALLSLKMMVNDGIKKEQSIKLLLVIVEKNGSTLHTPQHYFSTWFCVILYAYLSKSMHTKEKVAPYFDSPWKSLALRLKPSKS